MEPSFTSLPGDVQRNISQYPGTILSMSGLTRATKSYTNAEYLATVCQNPISMKEVQNSLRNLSSTMFGLFFTRKGRFSGFVYRMANTNDKTYFRKFVIDFVDSRTGDLLEQITDEMLTIMRSRGLKAVDMYVTGTSTTEDKTTKHDGEPHISSILADIYRTLNAGVFDGFDVDFTSQYYIYRDRLGCMTRNPRYAVDMIKGKIEYLRQLLYDQNLYKVGCAYYRLWIEFYIATGIDDHQTFPKILLDPNFVPLVPYDVTSYIRAGERYADYLFNYFRTWP